MADPLTLAELLDVQDRTVIRERLLAGLQGKDFPVTDWLPFGVERTIIEDEADALDELVGSHIPTIVGGGFLDLADSEWLTLLSFELYDNTRNDAINTNGRITLTSTPAAPSYTINPGDLWFLFPSGNLYNNTSGGTLAPNSTLVVEVTSEGPNDSLADPPLNYSDEGGSTIQMTTPLAGVTATNDNPDFSDVALDGSGTGTVTPSGTPDAHLYEILITEAGETGVAKYKWRIDNGAYSAEATTSGSEALTGTGTVVAFTDGTPVSFQLSDSFSFTAPGSWITQVGTDEEIDAALILRDRQRWPSISVVPTGDKYELWAKAASTQVTRAIATPDDDVPGQVDIIIAGQAGALPNTVTNAVKEYIQARQGIGNLVAVSSAVKFAVTLTGIVTVKASKISSVQQLAQATIQNMIDSTPLGTGTTNGGVVRLAKIEQLLMDAGATDVSELMINGSAENLVLALYDVATFGQDIADVLTWVVG